jgi:hypothetical protein
MSEFTKTYRVYVRSRSGDVYTLYAGSDRTKATETYAKEVSIRTGYDDMLKKLSGIAYVGFEELVKVTKLKREETHVL